MAKKMTGWKTKGMNRDLSVSAFNPELSFENMNLRLSTNEGNTLLSWVNEKGTKEVPIEIQKQVWNEGNWKYGQSEYIYRIEGIPLGTAVLDDKLVLFTKNEEETPLNEGETPLGDYIYLFEYKIPDVVEETEPFMKGCILYRGNLNFDLEHPIETLVSHEAAHILKVYWVDGVNQPRIINIYTGESNVANLIKWNTPRVHGTVDTCFDFVASIDTVASISVSREAASDGLFAPGVIQYCFTYYNKYRQQTNVIAVTPLNYISMQDRGASPTEKVAVSFAIKISGIDTFFEYIRVYSIQRTSVNATPIVKVIGDYATAETVILKDNGAIGYTIDPTELLFVGGREISALTMAEKDNTLFMGNIVEKNILVDKIQEVIDEHKDTDQLFTIDFVNNSLDKQLKLEHSTGIYGHTNTLLKDVGTISTFKGGEVYRFGFQLQKDTGEWTEPIFLEDKLNTKFPHTNVFSDTINMVSAEGNVNLAKIRSFIEDYDFSHFCCIRPVIVYPTIADRNILCQGVLNPTVFNVQDRKTNSPYAQASWFFRPYMVNASEPTGAGGAIEYVSVSFETAEYSADDYTVDEAFKGKTNLRSVGIGRVISLDTIKDKKITVISTSEGVESTFDVPIMGLIDLTSGYYAVVFMREMPELLTGNLAFTDFTDSRLDIDEHYYPMYNDMVTSDGMLMYKSYTGMPEDYVFKFWSSIDGVSKKYTATFYSHSDLDYKVKSGGGGTGLEFVHYNSLYTQYEYDHPAQASESSSENTQEGLEKGVEIQGSVNIYASAFVTPSEGNNNNEGNESDESNEGNEESTTTSNVVSNTQFMIDQSIVTLNSPDIEFDTDVQSYGTEGLKLRIIGAIPITANASAHSISLGSAMMEIGTNCNPTITQLFTELAEGNIFGKGELDYNVLHRNIDVNAGNRLVADYIWNDVMVWRRGGSGTDADNVESSYNKTNYLIHPWQRSGSLNTDTRTNDSASSLLKTKVFSHILYSINTEYFEDAGSTGDYIFDDISVQVPLTENSHVMNYRLSKQRSTYTVPSVDPPVTIEATPDINYYPNIDKVLYTNTGYHPITERDVIPPGHPVPDAVVSPVSMKYKSTSHAVVALGSGNSSWIPILPCAGTVGKYSNPEGTASTDTFWGDEKMVFSQKDLSSSLNELFKVHNGDTETHVEFNFLWLAELYKEPSEETRFGGKSKEALRNNVWCVAGSTQELTDGHPTLKWTIGDTYYQRYDCLKTYPFTKEDPNQLVEILSFMCETHVNIDGRYDRNRGQIDNTRMSPENFNLLNPVYSQKDNFFTARKTDTADFEELAYPNHITYSKTKTSGADVDLWTNVTLASTLEMDGDKGGVTSLQRLNDQLICFQERGLSQILYNENVQISSTEGVPIEIANSGKVQGKRYLSSKIGCDNKWSVCPTPSGIYFMDGYEKQIYMFNGQLTNLSQSGGMNSWCKKFIPTGAVWNPKTWGDSFISHYDRQNQEVLFVNKDTALAYSERVGAFTSFYDYGGAAWLDSVKGKGFWVAYKGAEGAEETKFWEHQAGDYCKFFGENKPYWMTLVGNPEPQMDKIFTNLEFRATVEGEGSVVESEGKYVPYLPFDSLEAWDEYQHGITILENKSGHGQFIHGGNSSALLRKFRIWRCDIPRDNAVIPEVTPLEEGETDENVIAEYEQALAERETFINSEHEKGIFRTGRRPLDRMRNPWIYLKLLKEAGEDVLPKVEIHDIVMSYFD